MTGALAVAAIVGLSATSFTALGGGSAEDTHAAPGSSTTHGGAQVPGLGKKLSFVVVWDGEPSRDGAVTPAATTTLGSVVAAIDPADHLRAGPLAMPLTISPNAKGALGSITGFGYWTLDGKAPVGVADRSKQLGNMTIAVLGRGEALQAGGPGSPCGFGDGPTFSIYASTPITWSPCVHHPQPDGSEVMTTHSEGLKTGQLTLAYRKFTDGSEVAVGARSFLQYNGDTPSADLSVVSQNTTGAALNPVPWTDASLAQALSGAGVKPLP